MTYYCRKGNFKGENTRRETLKGETVKMFSFVQYTSNIAPRQSNSRTELAAVRRLSGSSKPLEATTTNKTHTLD